jgi:hypothetical protein
MDSTRRWLHGKAQVACIYETERNTVRLAAYQPTVHMSVLVHSDACVYTLLLHAVGLLLLMLL